MSILARYRKPGGFKQLLQLIETSQPVKQEKLLEVVEKEDPHWADLIRQKKITPTMVLSWSNDNLATIFENMVAGHCATILKSLGEDKMLELRGLFQPNKYRELADLTDSIDQVRDGQLIAAYNNMLETVRYLDDEKIIDLRYIDPLLDLSEAA